MSDQAYNVLFICTGNSARSIMAEAILNHFGQGRFRAYSAGSHPKPSVNPLTLEILERQGYATQGLRSKSWNDFAKPGAPKMDFIFTVCDRAAGEVCPIWPGQPVTAHWGFKDPDAVKGGIETRRMAFEQAARLIANRIRLFLSLPIDKLDRMSLQSNLNDLGNQSSGPSLNT